MKVKKRFRHCSIHNFQKCIHCFFIFCPALLNGTACIRCKINIQRQKDVSLVYNQNAIPFHQKIFLLDRKEQFTEIYK